MKRRCLIMKDNNYSIVEIEDNYKITIPSEIVKMYNLKKGNKLQLVPEKDGFKIIPLPRSQSWFWNEKWQEGEKEADAAIKAGNVSREYESIDELINDLEK